MAEQIDNVVYTSGDSEPKMKFQTSRILRPFFPTTLELVGERIIVIYHQLFSSQKIELEIKDIYNIEIDSMLWFAEVVIYSRMFTDNQVKIAKLWKKDAHVFQEEVDKLRREAQPVVTVSPSVNTPT